MICLPFTAAVNVPGRRCFPTEFLEVGAPNLLVTAPGVYLCVPGLCLCVCMYVCFHICKHACMCMSAYVCVRVCGVFHNPKIVNVYL